MKVAELLMKQLFHKTADSCHYSALQKAEISYGFTLSMLEEAAKGFTSCG